MRTLVLVLVLGLAACDPLSASQVSECQQRCSDTVGLCMKAASEAGLCMSRLSCCNMSCTGSMPESCATGSLPEPCPLWPPAARGEKP